MPREMPLYLYDRMTPQAQEHFRIMARALAEGGARVREDEHENRSTETGEALAPA